MSDRVRALDLGPEQEIEEGVGDPFTAAFRATRMPMLITDARRIDNPIILVNNAFSDLTGYSREEVLGRNCRFLQGAETDRAEVARIKAAIAAGEAIETEILNYKKDGTPFWNALVISPVRSETGELLYFFASQSDASGKKRTRDQLEEAVVARTRDLQRALDQKTVLLHEVDHRVKNNLQVISSLVLLKARRMRDPAVQRALHNMAERISALSTVHRLLYSAGDVSRFDIRAFITDLSEDLLSSAQPGRITLRLELDPIGVSAAKATPLALLVNELVTNAVRHAFPDDRGGTLRVAASVQDSELRLVIEDDGVGVAGQAPSPEGFGRTLVDMLVRQLRGTINWQDTEPGTRAIVVVPLDTEEAQL